MILPFTTNVLDFIVEVLDSIISIGNKAVYKQALIGAGWRTDLWLVDTEGILVWTILFFVLGMLIGVLMGYLPRKHILIEKKEP